MHASSTFFPVSDQSAESAEPRWSMLVRYGVCAVVFGMVMLGMTVDGIVPNLPIELATLLG